MFSKQFLKKLLKKSHNYNHNQKCSPSCTVHTCQLIMDSRILSKPVRDVVLVYSDPTLVQSTHDRLRGEHMGGIMELIQHIYMHA